MDTTLIKRKDPLTTGEIAKYCHVTHRGVLKWVASGKLKSYRTPGKHSRINTEDFLNFLKQYRMPIPLELQPVEMLTKILIVDDDPLMVHALRRLFMKEKNYRIETAGDGFEAGKKFAAFGPDLMILDIYMPGLNGFQVFTNLRLDPANNKTKVIIISAAQDPEEIQKINNLGAEAFLQKPFNFNDLKSHVKRLVE